MTGKITLTARVGLLEKDMQVIKQGHLTIEASNQTMGVTLETISHGQDTILDALKTARNIRTFARKFVWPVVTAAATAGFLNPKVSTFLTALFA